MVVLYQRWRVLGYVHYRKQSPPPAPGIATTIGIFATTIGTAKSRLGWRIFLMNSIKNQINHSEKRRVQGGAGARTSRLRWQNFKYSLFSPLIISVVFLQCLSTEEKTTEMTIFPFKMIEVIKSLYSKFCHLNRDVRAPAPPAPSSFHCDLINF